MKALPLVILGVLLMAPISVWAGEVVIPMNVIDSSGVGKTIGTITASTSPYGTIFKPDLFK